LARSLERLTHFVKNMMAFNQKLEAQFQLQRKPAGIRDVLSKWGTPSETMFANDIRYAEVARLKSEVSFSVDTRFDASFDCTNGDQPELADYLKYEACRLNANLGYSNGDGTGRAHRSKKSRPRPCKAKRERCKQMINVLLNAHDEPTEELQQALACLDTERSYMLSLLGVAQQQPQQPQHLTRFDTTCQWV
jgi:hypothetical protein